MFSHILEKWMRKETVYSKHSLLKLWTEDFFCFLVEDQVKVYKCLVKTVILTWSYREVPKMFTDESL